MSKIACAAISVLAFAGGSGAGYYVARRQFEKNFEERVAMDVENEVEAIRRLSESAERRQRAAIEALERGLNTQAPVVLVEEEKLFYNRVQPALVADIPPKASAAFAKYQGVDEASVKIDPTKPYIITNEVFYEGDPGYTQVVLTYYEGDETLADEREDILDDPDSVVGNANLRFGHMSSDQNVVYVRNDRLGTDYEIVRSFGKYSVEVGGGSDNEFDPLPPEVEDA